MDVSLNILGGVNCEFQGPPLSMDEKAVMDRFNSTYMQDERERYTVQLPKREGVAPLGES